MRTAHISGPGIACCAAMAAILAGPILFAANADRDSKKAADSEKGSAAALNAEQQQNLDELNHHRSESRLQYKRQRFEKAAGEAAQAVAWARIAYGPTDVRVADDLRWLVQTEMDFDDYSKAREAMQQIVKIRAAVPGDPAGLAQEARSYLRYIERVQQLRPADRKELHDAIYQVADADRLEKLGKTDDAIVQAETGLARRKAVLGFADDVYAEYLALHGLRLLRTKGPKAAQPVLEESLEIRRDLLSERHRSYAADLMAIGTVYRHAGELDLAERQLARAAETFKLILGPTHETYRHAVEMRGNILEQIAKRTIEKNTNMSGAAKDYRRAAEVYAEAYPPNDWHVLDALNSAKQYEKMASLGLHDTNELSAAMDAMSEGIAQGKDGKTDEALKSLAKAQDHIAALVGEDSTLAMTCALVAGDLNYRRQQFDAAEQAYQRVVKGRTATLGLQHPQTQAAFDKLFELYHDREQAAAGREDWKTARAVLSRYLAAATQRYGAADWQTQDVRVRTKFVERLSALSPAERGQLEQADRLSCDATELMQRSQFTQALKKLSAAAEIQERILGSDHGVVAESYYGMADLHLKLEDYHSAEVLFESARKAQETVFGPRHPQVAQTLTELGILYNHLGDLPLAIKRLKEAREMFAATEGEQTLDYAWCTQNLASAYFQTRNIAEAEPLFQESLATLENIGAKGIRYANALNNLAGIYEHLGRLDLAEDLFIRAGKIWNDDHDPLDYARSLDNLAGLYMRQGEFSHAEVLNLEARKIFTDLLGAATPTAAINTSNLAYLYFKWGKLRQADQYAQLALAAEREILSLVASSQDESRQIESYRDARRSLDFYLTVSHALGRRTEETYRQVYAWKGTVFARQLLLRKVRQRPELRAQAAKLQEVSDRLAAILFSQPDPVHPELWKDQLDELAKERARRERELNQAIEPRAAPAASTDQLAAMLPAGIALVDLLEYMQSPAGPGKGGAAQLHLLAFVLRRDRQIVQVDLGASAPIVAAVDAWRTACVDRREFGVEEGQRLRQLVWLPLAKQLDAATTILIAPDGRLSQLPFAAIAGEKVGTQLIDDVAVAIVPVPQMLPELLRRAAAPAADDKPSLLLVGDLNYSAPPKSGRSQRSPRPTYRALPGSKVEIEVVDKLFRDRFPTITPKILHEHEATKSAVCNSMAASRFVHLATHGFFQPPGVQLSLNASGALGRGLTLESSAELPWRDMAESVVLPPGAMSGLVLSGANQSPIDKESSRNEGAGILTAFEVSELNLASTELVALSACQTALGEMAGGEGVLGLQRAFHIAGVPTVIASLWKVDDDATQPLMAEFYRRLWDAKQPLAKLESLREAQRYVRDHYRLESQRLVLATGRGLATGKSSETAPPFFWAAFVLSGDWR